MTTVDTLVLYEHPLSPYAQKVKLALMEKDITFSLKQLGNMSVEDHAAFLRMNPRGEVPVLVHNTLTLFDSTIILEYIEDCWPTPALLPVNADDRARVRTLEDLIDTHFEANTWGLSEVKHFNRATGDLAQHMNQFATDEIQQGYLWLAQQLDSKEWFNGKEFGWGDLSVIPFVNGAARFEIYPPANSALDEWYKRANARPSVARCKSDADGAELQAEVMTAALASGFKREYRDHRLEWMVRAGGIDVVVDGLAADNIRFIEAFK